MIINTSIDYHSENYPAPYVCKLWVLNGPSVWFAYMSEEIAKIKMVELKNKFDLDWFKIASLERFCSEG